MTQMQCYGANERFMCPSINCLPGSSSLLTTSKLPLGLIVTPQAMVPSSEAPVPVANGITSGIIRCFDCRAYISPFAVFGDGGHTWICSFCGVANTVPKSYYSPLDEKGVRQDLKSRPELTNSSIEYIASDDYTVRPPQAACYFFIIDTSLQSISSHFFHSSISVIRKHLDTLQGDSRTKIGFMTVGKEVHCFNLDPTLKHPELIVLSQTSQTPTLPHLSSTLLANFEESRTHVEYLLNNLTNMYAGPGIPSPSNKSCFPFAITLATNILASVGGLVMCFLSALSNTGYQKLAPRLDQSLVGTANEHKLLKPQLPWLSRLGHRANYSFNITISMFIGAPEYIDIASLHQLVKWTGGRLFYYPSFSVTRNGQLLEKHYLNYINSIVGFESVLRVRCSSGFSVSRFHGNFAVRNNDLMSLPVSHTDTSAVLELNVIDCNLPGSRFKKNRPRKTGPKRHFSNDPTGVHWGYFQAAHLFTAPTGERKIRIHTICMRITHNIADLYINANLNASCAVIVRQALLKAINTGLKTARDSFEQMSQQISGSYTSNCGQQMGTQSFLPPSLEYLPIFIRGFLKNYAFLQNTNIIVDYRSWLFSVILTLPRDAFVLFFKPNLWPVWNLDQEDYCIRGEPGTYPLSQLPPSLPLSRSSIHTAGIYIFDNGIDMFIWLGRSLHPQFIQQIFGLSVQNVNELNLTVLRLPEKPLDNPLSQRIHTLIDTCEQLYPLFSRQLYIVREGDSVEVSRIPSLLIQD